MTLKDYRTIVVGTDGSSLAAPTIARAARLAAHDDADLVIVCAWSALPRRAEAKNVHTGAADHRTSPVIGRSAANGALTDAVEVAARHGATVRAALLIEGEAGAALLSTAKDRDAQLIVMGSASSPSLAERLLGTVAGEVARRSRCDVLLVRPADSGPVEDRPESQD